MIENLLANLDIIIAIVVTFILTITIILIPIKIRIKHYFEHRYFIALAKIQTSYQKTLNTISEDVDFIRVECTDIYSIKRVKGRNDTQRSAIRRIKLYLDMIKSHITKWNVNGENDKKINQKKKIELSPETRKILEQSIVNCREKGYASEDIFGI